jgi:hypothetical protein
LKSKKNHQSFRRILESAGAKVWTDISHFSKENFHMCIIDYAKGSEVYKNLSKQSVPVIQISLVVKKWLSSDDKSNMSILPSNYIE